MEPKSGANTDPELDMNADPEPDTNTDPELDTDFASHTEHSCSYMEGAMHASG